MSLSDQLFDNSEIKSFVDFGLLLFAKRKTDLVMFSSVRSGNRGLCLVTLTHKELSGLAYAMAGVMRLANDVSPMGLQPVAIRPDHTAIKVIDAEAPALVSWSQIDTAPVATPRFTHLVILPTHREDDHCLSLKDRGDVTDSTCGLAFSDQFNSVSQETMSMSYRSIEWLLSNWATLPATFTEQLPISEVILSTPD